MAMLMIPPAPPAPVDPVDLAIRRAAEERGLFDMGEEPVPAAMLPGGQRGQRPDRPLAEGGGGGYAPSRKVSPEAQRYLDKTVRETEEFISKNNLPSISREQFINNLRLREGQMARDLREFNKSNPGEAYGGRQTLREIRELLRAFGE